MCVYGGTRICTVTYSRYPLGGLSADCWPSVGRLSATVGRLSAVCRPTVLLVNCRPTVGGVSVGCPSGVGEVSAECRWTVGEVLVK